MAAYLSSKDTPRPVKIDATSKRESGKQYGTVSVNFDSGSLYIVPNKRGGAPGEFRLVWDKKEKKKKLSVPVGTYRIVNYKIEREHKGVAWTLSATGREAKVINVRKGRNTGIKFNDTVYLKLNVKGKRKKTLTLGMQGENHTGITVIKDRNRIDIGYEIVGRSGKIIRKDSMAYG